MKTRWITPERARKQIEEMDAGRPAFIPAWTPERERKAREGMRVIINEAVRPEEWEQSPPAPESPDQE